jgi:hypothetical protein
LPSGKQIAEDIFLRIYAHFWPVTPQSAKISLKTLTEIPQRANLTHADGAHSAFVGDAIDELVFWLRSDVLSTRDLIYLTAIRMDVDAYLNIVDLLKTGGTAWVLTWQP